MPLSSEDSLRLHVLANQQVMAIRIDESAMILTALTDKGEATIALHPDVRHEAYLKQVREFLSEQYLGMPGGYPVHISRWSRAGHARNSIDKMLLLGEPEAIIAASRSGNMTAKLAACVWWAQQSTEIACGLLGNDSVVQDSLGVELAGFLLEFMPFEESSLSVVESVRLCLQGNVLGTEQKSLLWRRAARKNIYYAGFLLAGSAVIPLQEDAHAELAETRRSLSRCVVKNNCFADVFLRFLEAPGRQWLSTLLLALRKPAEQDIVTALFVALQQHVGARLDLGVVSDCEIASENAQAWLDGKGQNVELLKMASCLQPDMMCRFEALLVLAQLGEETLTPIFSGRDSSGSVMRKHLQPLTDSIAENVTALMR
ncbi:MAG: hypothetical protein V3U76_00095 [Granulosicoccus sp.]